MLIPFQNLRVGLAEDSLRSHHNFFILKLQDSETVSTNNSLALNLLLNYRFPYRDHATHTAMINNNHTIL